MDSKFRRGKKLEYVFISVPAPDVLVLLFLPPRILNSTTHRPLSQESERTGELRFENRGIEYIIYFLFFNV